MPTSLRRHACIDRQLRHRGRRLRRAAFRLPADVGDAFDQQQQRIEPGGLARPMPAASSRSRLREIFWVYRRLVVRAAGLLRQFVPSKCFTAAMLRPQSRQRWDTARRARSRFKARLDEMRKPRDGTREFLFACATLAACGGIDLHALHSRNGICDARPIHLNSRRSSRRSVSDCNSRNKSPAEMATRVCDHQGSSHYRRDRKLHDRARRLLSSSSLFS